ncbi:MAG: AAA family ATPase [Spirochaetales bacterium]|nr:AAA family ATPase [Spirochaetales bacterium]
MLRPETKSLWPMKIQWLTQRFHGKSIMINRAFEIGQILEKLEQFPVVAIIGARQVGKTTLTHQIEKIADQLMHRFDLENPEDLARLNDPMLALKNLKGIVILDEIQRRAELFPVLRVLADLVLLIQL